MRPRSTSALAGSASVRHIGEHVEHTVAVRPSYVRTDPASALRASEERSQQLAAIVDQSESAIITKNLDNVVLTWNRGAEQIGRAHV